MQGNFSQYTQALVISGVCLLCTRNVSAEDMRIDIEGCSFEFVEVPGCSLLFGKTEVTQKQWMALMHSNPSLFRGDDLPVENISWKDAQNLIDKLNQSEALKERGVIASMPSQGEWMIACGPTPEKYADSVWDRKNSGLKTHPVASKKSNIHGLYDMLGNVYEYCVEKHGDNEIWPMGGCWNTKHPTANWHGKNSVDDRSEKLGFRICLARGSKKTKENGFGDGIGEGKSDKAITGNDDESKQTILNQNVVDHRSYSYVAETRKGVRAPQSAEVREEIKPVPTRKEEQYYLRLKCWYEGQLAYYGLKETYYNVSLLYDSDDLSLLSDNFETLSIHRFGSNMTYSKAFPVGFARELLRTRRDIDDYEVKFCGKKRLTEEEERRIKIKREKQMEAEEAANRAKEAREEKYQKKISRIQSQIDSFERRIQNCREGVGATASDIATKNRLKGKLRELKGELKRCKKQGY